MKNLPSNSKFSETERLYFSCQVVGYVSETPSGYSWAVGSPSGRPAQQRGGVVERPHILAVLLLTLTVAAYPDHAEPTWPTPEITQIDALDAPHAVAYAMRGELGDSGAYVGLALLCTTRGPTTIEVTAFFGAFPGSHHPVQLAVQSPNGTDEGVGPVVRAGPESGFHSPQITDPQDAGRFVRLALQPGALVSNGYRSFWEPGECGAQPGGARGVPGLYPA